MALLYLLIVLVLLNIIYVIGFLGAQVLRKSRQHYFLGFNPGFLTISLRNVKFTIGVYIPIVGFSRIYCVDKSGIQHLFYPWRSSHTSLPKRLLLTYSGVIMLFFVGMLLSILTVYTSEDQYISKEEVLKHGIYPSQQAYAVGFRPGDRVIAINGKDYRDFVELIDQETVHARQTDYTVVRNDQQLVLSINDSVTSDLPQHELLFTINAPFSVREVLMGSPAEAAGILPGDKILKVNGHLVASFQEMNSYFELDDDGQVSLDIQRGNNAQIFQRTIALTENKKIGVSIDQKIEFKTKAHSLLESLPLGIFQFGSSIATQFKIFERLIGPPFGQERKKLSGPISIQSMFDYFSLSWFISFTSLYIAFVIMVNLLPLPKSAMLEVIPLGYEAVRKKQLTLKRFLMIRRISIWVLVTLLAWQFVRDLFILFNQYDV